MRWIGLCLCVCLLFQMPGCAQATDGRVRLGTVLIDPGHGGFDGGTVAEDGTLEKHLNLAVSLYLRDLLHVCGVAVEMTRQTDVGLETDFSATVRNKKASDMRRRLAMYEEASLVISVHQNHFSQSKYSGTQVFYSANHPDSAVLAEDIRSAVVEWIQPQNTRELKKATDSIFLLTHTTTPAVLVECGFLSNEEERNKLKTPAYQQQVAFAIMAGYWKYQTQ